MTAVVYDVTRDSVAGGVWFLASGGLISAFVGIGALLAWRGIARRAECVAQLESGEFQVTSGSIHEVQHGGRNPGLAYSFLLGGERIVFGDAIVGPCGIAPPVGSRRAPSEGERLRIEHDGDRTFRVLLEGG